MATKKVWNKIFEDFDAMSDAEFLAFVEECEKTPDVPLVGFGVNYRDFSPITGESDFFISVASVCVDSPSDIEYDGDDWAWVA